jgi:hypothetical protein
MDGKLRGRPKDNPWAGRAAAGVIQEAPQINPPTRQSAVADHPAAHAEDLHRGGLDRQA